MEQVEPPESYTQNLINSQTHIIGPPPGVSREHCIEAKVCVTDDWLDDGMGLAFIMFCKPNEQELESLNNGGLLKLTIRGHGLVPHNVGVWPNG